MDDHKLLDQITVRTPCPMDWNRMRGDDRVRYCDSCGKYVYNFAAMTSDEVVSLIRAPDRGVCGRIFRRPDGTLVTSDCQPALQPPPGPWQIRIRSVMAVIAGLAAALGIARLFLPSDDLPPRTPAPGPGATTQLLGLFLPSDDPPPRTLAPGPGAATQLLGDIY
jgi:hypothetical protein